MEYRNKGEIKPTAVLAYRYSDQSPHYNGNLGDNIDWLCWFCITWVYAFTAEVL